MRENFLHYLWKFKKFETLHLKGVSNENIILINSGQHNFNSGPDFFNAKLKINGQLWAGNIEIHIKASDWYLHGHERDKAYDNVILHVVWEHDIDVLRNDNSKIPTLELKNYVSQQALFIYHKLFEKSQKWINCEDDFASVDDFIINNWLERLYFERLERKALEIEALLKSSNNDWEAVMFKMLARNFGLNVNGDAFLSIANSIDFSIIRKQQADLMGLEALFFGQASLLEETMEEPYFNKMKCEYVFLKQKFKLSNQQLIPIKFFRLRPLNFPTIRLSQLANLYHQNMTLFSKVVKANSIQDFYDLFSFGTSPFWETHYTFKKVSKSSEKKLTKSFIDLILINSIIPLKFSYAKFHGKMIDEDILNLIQNIASENNGIIKKYNSLRKVSQSALQSQALIQLKNKYCDKNKCLQCAVGNALLNRNM